MKTEIIKYYIPKKGDRFILNKDAIAYYQSNDCDGNFNKRLKLCAGDEFVFAVDQDDTEYKMLNLFFVKKASKKVFQKTVASIFNHDATLVCHKQKIKALRAEFDPAYAKALETSNKKMKKSRKIKKAFEKRIFDASKGKDVFIQSSLYEMLHTINQALDALGFTIEWKIDDVYTMRWHGNTRIDDDGMFRAKFAIRYPCILTWFFEGKITDDGEIVDAILFPSFK